MDLIKKPKKIVELLTLFNLESEIEILDELAFVEEDPRYHQEGTTLNHIQLFFDNLPEYCERWLAISALLHDIGKLYTTRENNFKGHEEKSYRYAKNLLPKTNLDEIEIEKILFVIRNHGRLLDDSYKEIIKEPYFKELLLFHFFDSVSMEPANLGRFEIVRKEFNSLHSHVASLALHITSRCNLTCTHCYSVFENKSMPDLSIQTISKVLADCKVMGLDSIVLFGGEPFVRKDLSELIDLCVKYGIEPEVITNGTLVNFDKLRELKEIGLRKIGFSLDGEKRNHENIRGCGSYDSIMQAITDANELGYHIRVNTVVTKSNKDSILSLTRALENKIDKHKIIYYTPFGRGEIKEWIPADEWIEFCSQLKWQHSKSSRAKLSIEQPYSKEGGVLCKLEHPVVLTDGTLYPCILFLNSPFDIGNVHHDNFFNLCNNNWNCITKENSFCVGYSHLLAKDISINPKELIDLRGDNLGCCLLDRYDKIASPNEKGLAH